MRPWDSWQASIFATLSAILHLGNLEIRVADDTDGNAEIPDNNHMMVAPLTTVTRDFSSYQLSSQFTVSQ
jgi:myosin heavy subunit